MDWTTWIIAVVGLFLAPVTAYKTYYIEDECLSQKHLQKVEYNIPALGPDSVGELRTNRFGTYSRGGRNCLIKLIPPSNHDIVVSVTKVDFRNHKMCEDYIKIYHEDNKDGEKLCGYQERGLDSKAFYSKDKMKILYHTEDGGWGSSDGFRLIFTVTKMADEKSESCSSTLQYKCANNRCIWVGVTCDGRDNCGDASDEYGSGNAQCPLISPVIIGAIVFGTTVLTAALIAVVICCCRNRPSNAKKISSLIAQRKYGYYPLAGYTYGSFEKPLMTQLSLQPTAPTEKMVIPYLDYQTLNLTSPTISSYKQSSSVVF